MAPTYIREGYKFTMAKWKGEVIRITMIRNRKIVFNVFFRSDKFSCT